MFIFKCKPKNTSAVSYQMELFSTTATLDLLEIRLGRAFTCATMLTKICFLLKNSKNSSDVLV